MPTPPLTLDHEAVEAALPVGVRAALPALMEVWGVRGGRWWGHPLVSDFLTLAAVQTLAEVRAQQGHSRTRALRLACLELGLNDETVRSRLARARKTYLDGPETGGKSPPTPSEKRASLHQNPRMETT